MRITQIGTLSFNTTTNVIVDSLALDVPGTGFRLQSLPNPTPFSVDIAFIRSTRQAALDAVNSFGRELFSYSQRRTTSYFARAGGMKVVIEDANGNNSLASYLQDGSMTLLGVERTSSGVVAKVRLMGTLVGPFLAEAYQANQINALKPYERRIVTLPNLSNNALYAHEFLCTLTASTGIYNTLLVFEERETQTAVSRITAINPATTSSGLSTDTYDAIWMTIVRVLFSQNTNGTITYNITPGSLPRDAYRLFVEIYTPSTPTNARYTISWGGQPQIKESISGTRSWYSPGIYARGYENTTVTLQLTNVPTNTIVMPLIFIPVDGAYVLNVVATTPPITFFHSMYPQTANEMPMNVRQDGLIYGDPNIITSRFITVFSGMTKSNISGLWTNVEMRSYRIEPAAFI